MTLKINDDITKACTLDSEFYRSERYFIDSKEKIFARTWQFLDLTDEVEALKPFTLLEGFLDEPLLVIKDKDGVRCLSNVCTHRAKLLVEKPCKTNVIRCSYHGRRFSLEGKMLSMPEFEGVRSFPSEEDNLKKLPLGIWEKLIFVSLEPADTFENFFGDLRHYVCNLGLNFKRILRKDYAVQAHWALYCENYLEGFHIPFVHKGLNQVLNYDDYLTITFRFSSLQIGFTDRDEFAFDCLIPGIDSEKKVAALYFFIFPNLMLNFYPWGLSLNIVKPVRLDKTIVSYITLISDESKMGCGAGSDLESVEMEDQHVVESVQKGIRSRFFKHGRYSAKREKGLHHFHKLIVEFMNAGR